MYNNIGDETENRQLLYGQSENQNFEFETSQTQNQESQSENHLNETHTQGLLSNRSVTHHTDDQIENHQQLSQNAKLNLGLAEKKENRTVTVSQPSSLPVGVCRSDSESPRPPLLSSKIQAVQQNHNVNGPHGRVLVGSYPHHATGMRNVRLHHVPPNNHSPRLPTFINHHQSSSGFQRFNGHSEYPPYDQSQFQYGQKNVVSRAIRPQNAASNTEAVEHMNSSQTHASNHLPTYGSSTAVSAATHTAIANIVSLINNASTSSDSLTSSSNSQVNGVQSPTLPASSSLANHQRTVYQGHGYMPPMNNGQHSSNHNYHPTNQVGMEKDSSYGMIGDNGAHLNHNPAMMSQHNIMSDKTLLLQRELEQERSLRLQLQQKVMELTQKVQSQQLVEESYEALTQKYKMLYSQMQQMAHVIERYKAALSRVEHDKIMLYKENVSHKAQENVANDKTILYNILVERSKKMEEENSGLVLENEMYQRQYEKYIDEISKQVVQALLTQKALQEQCLHLQDRLAELERENSEYYEAAVRQARQASSDSRLGWSYKGTKARTHTASPSADSVRSMPAQHHYWRQSSVSSLETQQHQTEVASGERIPEHSTQSLWTEAQTAPTPSDGVGAVAPNSSAFSAVNSQTISIETEFPANNGSPKSTRRSLDRHPSSGSLDSAYHSRGFVKNSGKDVRCQRSVSAEALRDMKVTMRPKHDLTLPSMSKSTTTPAMSSYKQSANTVVQADVHHADLSPGSTIGATTSAMTDSGVVNDPFAEDADDILSKHQSLIVGSMEDLFGVGGSNVRDYVIHEEESGGSNSALSSQGRHSRTAPTPPPRPRSTCLSDSSFTDNVVCDQGAAGADGGPPPLPPKQYKGSRRKYKPLPAEPPEFEEDSSDRNTDSDSIKQEINALTSKIVRMTSSSAHQ